MSRKALPLSSLALLLNTAASVEALTWSEAGAYLTQGLQPIFSSAALASTNKHVLQPRRLQKRYEVCSYYGDIIYYCHSPTHCLSDTTCSFNYTWVIVAVVVILIIVIFIRFYRRRRQNQNNIAASNQMVLTSISPAPGQGNTTSVTYQPQMNYVPEVQNSSPMNNGGYDPNQLQHLQYPPAVPVNVQQQYSALEAPYMADSPAPLYAPYSPYPSNQPTPNLATGYSPYPSEHSQKVVQASTLAQLQHLDNEANSPNYSAYPVQPHQQQYYNPPLDVPQPMMHTEQPVGTVAGIPLQYQARQPQYYEAYDQNVVTGATGVPRQPQNPQQTDNVTF